MEHMSIKKKVYGEREFIKVVPENQDQIVTYQLLMVTGNQIPGLLEVSRRQNNDEVALLYDITNKQALSEIIKNRKLTRLETEELIETVVKAESNGRAYQLPDKGICIDPDYIFLSKNKTEVSLMYLPFYEEDAGTDELCGLLKNMIMNGQIENTNDGFVGALIDVMNREDLSYSLLGEFIRKQRSGNHTPKPKNTPAHSGQGNAVPYVKPQPVRTVPPAPIAQQPVQPVPSGASSAQTTVSSAEKRDKKEKAKTSGGSKKNVIFILAAGAAVILLAALCASGVFVVDGTFRAEYLAAAVIGCGAVLFIVYRELFINKKNKKQETADQAPAEKKQPPFASKAAPPVPKQPPFPAKKPPVKTEAKKENAPKAVLPRKKTEPKTPAVSERPQAESYAYTPVQTAADNAYDDDMCATEIMDEGGSGRAYLEYFDNGIPTRFYFNNGSILVGKQKSRVTYAIAENTVSRVHAEFGIDGEGYYVKDCSSANGTYINEGERLIPDRAYSISDGDTIRLAKIELIFHC